MNEKYKTKCESCGNEFQRIFGFACNFWYPAGVCRECLGPSFKELEERMRRLFLGQEEDLEI